METRITTRQKDFKKAAYDPQRRRKDDQVQIRKAARDEILAKRRAGEDTFGDERSQKDMSIDPSQYSIDNDDIANLTSPDPEVLIKAVNNVRKVLSMDQSPPIKECVQRGVVPPLVALLNNVSINAQIRFEAAWALTNIASGDSLDTDCVIQCGGAEAFLNVLREPNTQALVEQACWGIGNCAGNGVDARQFLMKFGVVDLLLNILNSSDDPSMRIGTVRYSTWALSNICRGSKEMTIDIARKILSTIRLTIATEDREIAQDSAWAITYLCDYFNKLGNNQVGSYAITLGLPAHVIRILNSPHATCWTPSIRCLGTLLTGDDRDTDNLIAIGAIPALKNMLNCPRANIRKEVFWALSNITAGTNAQILEVINSGVISMIIKSYMDNQLTFDQQKEACWVISNATNGIAREELGRIIEMGAIQMFCKCLDIPENRIRIIVLESIEMILGFGENQKKTLGLDENPYLITFEENHLYNHLEEYQTWDSFPRIQAIALRIISTYLEIDEEDANVPDNEAYQFNAMI